MQVVMNLQSVQCVRRFPVLIRDIVWLQYTRTRSMMISLLAGGQDRRRRVVPNLRAVMLVTFLLQVVAVSATLVISLAK
jgi:hypothetical protein